MAGRRMGLYDWFERIGWPGTYRGRVIAVAVLATNVPLLLLAVLLFSGALPLVTTQVLLAVAAASLMASGALAWLLGQLLEPVAATSSALVRFREAGQVPRLPTHYQDEVGHLMQGVTRALHTVTRQQYELEARHSRDFLTGLFTRTMAETLLDQNILYARREGTAFSVALLDVDRMELVNNAFGRVAGDEVLRRVGRLIQAQLRGSDWAARWRGASMLIVLYAPPSGARHALERLRGALVDMDHPVVTVSVGCVAFQPIDTSVELLERASVALAEAKRGGRNQVRVVP